MQPVESDIADADILRDAVKKYAVIDGDKCGQNVEWQKNGRICGVHRLNRAEISHNAIDNAYYWSPSLGHTSPFFFSEIEIYKNPQMAKNRTEVSIHRTGGHQAEHCHAFQ